MCREDIPPDVSFLVVDSGPSREIFFGLHIAYDIYMWSWYVYSSRCEYSYSSPIDELMLDVQAIKMDY
jgi:hypothetical protein